MTATIDPRDKGAARKVLEAMSDRKPYVRVKDLRGAVETAAKKGGKR